MAPRTWWTPVVVLLVACGSNGVGGTGGGAAGGGSTGGTGGGTAGGMGGGSAGGIGGGDAGGMGGGGAAGIGGGTAGGMGGGSAGGVGGGSAGGMGGGNAGGVGGGTGGGMDAGTGGGMDAGTGGGMDAGTVGWPTCDMPPTGVPLKTVHDIWGDNPSTPTAVWVPGVFVTAISGSRCVAGSPCQIFVQQAETFASLAAGSQQSLKLFVSANAATHFTAVHVGDQVDIYAYADRDPTTNELLLEVNVQLQGCAKTVGTGTPVPVVVTLDDLSVTAYESTVGPLFVEVDGVSGRPQTATEIFALWKTGTFSDAGISTVTNLSPYMLSNGVFTTLTTGRVTDFNFIRGVFAIVPLGSPTVKYEVLYPRVESADVSILLVH